MSTDDPLQALVVDEDVIAREAVADVLSGLVLLSRQGDLVMQPAFTSLPARQQVLAILLSLRAAQLLDLREQASVTPAQIVEMSGMAPGTVRPKLSALLGQRLIRKGPGGAYEIPAHSINRAVDELKR